MSILIKLTGQNISDSLHISLSDSPLEIFAGLRFLCGWHSDNSTPGTWTKIIHTLQSVSVLCASLQTFKNIPVEKKGETYWKIK